MAGERADKTLRQYRKHYHAAKAREEKTKLLDAFCKVTGYHRKYAIGLLNLPPEDGQAPAPPRARRGYTYSAKSVRVLAAIWEAAGYPWSERLKAMLPQWLPWARRHLPELSPEVEKELRSISARQIDRRLKKKKRGLKRRLYGCTKPGSLLRRSIPVRTTHADCTGPGWVEIDLVAHCGPSASGEFIHSLNLTDIHTGWCQTRAIMGRGETGVVEALEDIRQSLPFALQGVHSDNGSEFINHHLVRYCRTHRIEFSRTRPYKKDDNAHIEQKNWTHVRKIFGWDRMDTQAQQQAMNALYRGPVGQMMNFYQASVKLREKEHVGSKLRRRYDAAMTPLDRLAAWYEKGSRPKAVAALLRARAALDPFTLSAEIDRKLTRLSRAGRGKRAA